MNYNHLLTSGQMGKSIVIEGEFGHATITARPAYIRLIFGAVLIGLAIAPVCLVAGKKARDWKTGKVADSTATNTVKKILVVVGDEYAYTIEDATYEGNGHLGGEIFAGLANRKKGCRFIVGDSVKYAQEKDQLYILDVDGKECKLDILRQERRQ